MKNYLLLLFCLFTLETFGQPKPDFDGKTWEAPYLLEMPQGWDIERFLIPIEFAPSIPYKGIEDIRFTPGWGNVKSNEYWTYGFLWYLDNKPQMTATIVASNLRAYYSGLVGRNISSRKIPSDKLFPVQSQMKAIITAPGDAKTFRGTIHMLDYMEQKPITLNCIVHVRLCPGQDKTFVFNEISPKPFTDSVWIGLNQLWTNFKCDSMKKNK
ncbi:MAG TPA: hypothetical protein VL307_11210 [Chitinophagaceae bacterium]|jgi:hypothetical protein|nr:hypothetical protein [Chitinophagaceae bacterium]